MKTKRPSPKEFDSSKYEKMIKKLRPNMGTLKFERLSEVIVPYVLENYEGFRRVEKGPKFAGTPFDFFGFKEGRPYVIEYKGSLNTFNAPGETQKRRLQELRDKIEGLRLHVALLQVKFMKSNPKSQYRIFYDDELELLFKGKKEKLDPIVSWLKERLKNA